MKRKFAVTISRQFGSGGREIGLRLAEMLGVKCYDRSLISRAAERSGLSGELIKENDEKAPTPWNYALSFGFTQGFSQDSLFKIQSDVILDIARNESCIIVGRSADYVLRNHKSCFNIFISSPLKSRIDLVISRAEVSCKEATSMVEKIDKDRKAYYNFYTNKRWGECESYHLSIDSSLLGIEQTAISIYEFITKSLEQEVVK